jgi:hypothetical protein
MTRASPPLGSATPILLPLKAGAESSGYTYDFGPTSFMALLAFI